MEVRAPGSGDVAKVLRSDVSAVCTWPLLWRATQPSAPTVG